MRSCTFRTQIAVTALVWQLPALVAAQDSSTASPGDSNAASTLPRLEITADTADVAPRTGDVVPSEHTGSSSTLARTRIEQPGAQLADLLSSSSGIQQRQSGGFGTFSSISVRGSSAAQTAVYLDGILLNSAGESVIDLSTLELLNLASVDIYKGSSPAQLGHSAIGGAINLNTLGATDAKGTSIRLGLGSFSQQSLAVATRGTASQWSWTGSLSHQQSENDFPFTDDNNTPLNDSDDTRQTRQNSQVRRTSALLKLGFKHSDLQRSNLLIQTSNRDLGVPSAFNRADNDASFDSIKTQVHASHSIDQWKDWNSRHSFYWHQSDTFFDDSRGQVNNTNPQRIDTDVRTLGLKTYWERFVTAGTLGFSLEVRDNDLDLQDDLNTNESFIASEQQALVTTHLAILDNTETWLLTPSVHWQFSKRRGTSTSIGVADTLPTVNEQEPGAQLGAAYSITPEIRLSANAGSHFRSPSFDELYGSIGLINGNPLLEPERGINLDASIRYATKSLQLEAAVFQNSRDQLIVTSFNSVGIGRPINTGKAEVTGLELSGTWNPVTQWMITANATWQDPRIRNNEAGAFNNQLPSEPRQSYFLRTQYKPGTTGFWYEWQGSRDRFFDRANLLPAANISVHNIGLDYTHKHWQFTASILNVSDEAVEDFNGFVKPGRSYALSLKLQL